MREINKISEALFEKIRDRFEDVSLGDENAKATQNPENARFFNFDYTVDGKNHGNITLSVIDEISLKVYFSKNISNKLEGEERQQWYNFLRELREFARRNLMSFEPRDITRSTLKHRDIQQQSKADSTYSKDEVIGEGRMYGTHKSSYEKDGNVKLIVRHSESVNPEQRGARSRKIKSIFVETSEGERIKLPHNNLRYARAMARHVSEGGQLTDDFGQHITRIAEECGKLRPFKHSVTRRTFEDSETQAMVEAAFEYHSLLNNTLKRMSGRKGYAACKESFIQDEPLMDNFDVDSLRERFVKRTYNDKMEDALPIVQKAYEMKKSNKFAEQFESWANNVAESYDNSIDVDDLAELLSDPIPFGVDAINATTAIEGIIANDEFVREMEKAAQEDPEADARDFILFWLEQNDPMVYQEVLNDIGDADTADEYGASGMDEPNVNEDSEATKYGVFRRGGSLGSRGGLIKTFDTKEEAQEYAKRQRRHLTPGERSYYKMGYTVKAVKDEEINEGVYEEDTYDEDNVEAVQTAILRRILGNINQHSELLKAVGPEGVMNAARDVASFHAPVDELGSSDISIMVREVYQEAGVEFPELNEADSAPLRKTASASKKAKDAKYYDYLARTLGEGRVKELEMDLKDLTDAEFVAKYNKTKAEMKAGLSEGVGDDYANKKEKLARAGAHRAPKKPEQSFLDKVKSTAKGAKAWVKGEDDSMYESDDTELNEMLRIAGLK